VSEEALGLLGGGHPLVPHPQTPPCAVPGVFCTYVWKNAGEWRFDFIVPVAPSLLKLPAAAPAQRTDELWLHTCFELFLLDPESGTYREFNFAPSGQWAAYSFEKYREERQPLEVAAPHILSTDPGQFALAMETRLRRLGLDDDSIRLLADASPTLDEPVQFALSAGLEDPSRADGRPLLAGLSAIIEEADGTRSYWALAHPPGEPDFHHPDCFALELPAAA
jgi:hypothetical protein